MTKKYSASARVIMSLDMDHGSSYGTGCSIDQIHAQASRETVERLKRILREEGIRNVTVTVEKVYVGIIEVKE
jgi:hypothetical protein